MADCRAVRHFLRGEEFAVNSRYFTLGLTVLAIFVVFRFFLPLVLPFVLAYFFAKMISPVIRFLTEKWRWNRRVSAISVVVVVVAGLAAFAIYIGSMAIGQLIHLLQRFPVYEQMAGRTLENFCCQCDRLLEFGNGTSYRFVQAQTAKLYTNIGNDLLPKLYSCAAEVIRWAAKAGSGVFIFFLSAMLILLDDTFPSVHKKIRPFMSRLKKAGFAYIKAQSIIIFLIAVAISIGLFVIGNDYAILLGVGIAVFDAFPILGSGIILIPWALIEVFGGNFFEAAVLVTLFAVATFLREVMEPKLFGKELGMKPLYVLISIYVGVKLFGLGGILLGPVALTILKAVDDMVKEALG